MFAEHVRFNTLFCLFLSEINSIARSLTPLSWLRFEKLCLQLYFIVDFSWRLICCINLRRWQVSRWWYCFSGALKSVVANGTAVVYFCVGLLWSAVDTISRRFFFLRSVWAIQPSSYCTIGLSVCLPSIPRICVGFHLVLRENINTCVVCFILHWFALLRCNGDVTIAPLVHGIVDRS